MKVLLIAERDELYTTIEHYFRSYGAEVLRYWNPVKAMDNLDEISPNVVVFSSEDFPRHWKVFLAFLRFSFKKEELPFVLLRGDGFDYDEASKATQLEVNGIVREDLGDSAELERLKSIFERYGKIENIPVPAVASSYEPGPEDRIDLLFTHPDTLVLIRGKVSRISGRNISFQPVNPEKTENLQPNTFIPACSIRIGTVIHTIDLELIENSGELVFRFVVIPKEIAEFLGPSPANIREC